MNASLLLIFPSRESYKTALRALPRNARRSSLANTRKSRLSVISIESGKRKRAGSPAYDNSWSKTDNKKSSWASSFACAPTCQPSSELCVKQVGEEGRITDHIRFCLLCLPQPLNKALILTDRVIRWGYSADPRCSYLRPMEKSRLFVKNRHHFSTANTAMPKVSRENKTDTRSAWDQWGG